MKVTIEVNELTSEVTYKTEPPIPSDQFCILLSNVVINETWKEINARQKRLVVPASGLVK